MYKINSNNSYLKQGKQFDLFDFQAERSRLTSLFRNSGVYNFQESSIEFDVHRDTISQNNDFKMPVTIQIGNPTRRENDSIWEEEYKVHHLKNIHLYIDSGPTTATDSINYSGYTIFYKDKLICYTILYAGI